jgi:predicted MFS family arabinose efflux permease
MRSITLLVFAQRVTHSFSIAGLVTGVYAAGNATGGPILGRLVDRYGQTLVLLIAASASSMLMVTIALVPDDIPRPLLVALAAAIGIATPPMNGCARALLPSIVTDGDALRRTFAVEATGLELTFIAGPPLALGLAAVWSTRAALAIAGILILLGTAAFAKQPGSRHWNPPLPRHARPIGPLGSLSSPPMHTFAVLLVAVGVLFGATEVGVTACATRLGHTAESGLLLGLWGVGSLIGGIAVTRSGGGAQSRRGLMSILALLAVTHAALAAATGDLVALGAIIVVAGLAIAPAYASIYAMVDRYAPLGTVTEAFAWLATCVVAGTATGMAAGGELVQSFGPSCSFMLAGLSGAAALGILYFRSGSFTDPTASVGGGTIACVEGTVEL